MHRRNTEDLRVKIKFWYELEKILMRNINTIDTTSHDTC